MALDPEVAAFLESQQGSAPIMHIEQKFGVATGNTSILRIRYYNIQPDRFSWTADRSTDGGKTWTREDQKIEAKRIGPARSLGALAPAR
jgi:hypothetical protein